MGRLLHASGGSTPFSSFLLARRSACVLPGLSRVDDWIIRNYRISNLAHFESMCWWWGDVTFSVKVWYPKEA
jgi:hypothetical protein